MIEQVVETRAWKAVRGLIEDGRRRICFSHSETVEQPVDGCRVLANSEYLARHNRALMNLIGAWAKEYEGRYSMVQRKVVARYSTGKW